MKLFLEHIGRRYNRDWIFRDVDLTMSVGGSYAILGPNGSGKSTLLKIISGQLSPSEGTVRYEDSKQQPISPEHVYKEISIAAPYVDLIEEFSYQELVDFHFRFKKLIPGIRKDDLYDISNLSHVKQRQIKYFSSGMKQRVKLILACLSQGTLLLLDEPMSNLDTEGEEWLLEVLKHAKMESRVLIIASNQLKEYEFCKEKIHISDYKNK